MVAVRDGNRVFVFLLLSELSSATFQRRPNGDEAFVGFTQQETRERKLRRRRIIRTRKPPKRTDEAKTDAPFIPQSSETSETVPRPDVETFRVPQNSGAIQTTQV